MAKETIKPFPQIEAAEPSKVGERKKGIEDVQGYLKRFGYFERDNFRTGEFDNETSKALTKFQERKKLQTTGEFDEETKSEMTKHRCGMPDLFDGVAAVTRCAWTKRNLTYAFTNATDDINNPQQVFGAVRNAFDTWSSVVQLRFTEVDINDNYDIEIGWYNSICRDYNMSGGILAHADFPPSCGVVGSPFSPRPLHYDQQEHLWVIGQVTNGFDIESLAVHEIGHILGLGHTGVNQAVMYESIPSNFTKRGLHPDDIFGITSLYPFA